MSRKKESSKVKSPVGKLIQVVGWMSPGEKEKFLAALKMHPFLNGQSDFINQAASALITHAEKNKEALAQPLCFMTVEQRDMLAALKLKERKKI